MLKQKSVLEVKTNDRIYQLSCDSDSPLGELYDAITQMNSFVINRINEIEKKKKEHQQSEEVEVVVE